MKDEEITGQDVRHVRNARAKLLLVPCTNPTCNFPECPNHGSVVMELDGEQAPMGEVRTRAEAYGHLLLFKQAVPGHSPQPEFLSAIRQADWLTGEMPSALFTPAGTRQGDKRSRLIAPSASKVQVVPMPPGHVANLRAKGDESDQASVSALRGKGWF